MAQFGGTFTKLGDAATGSVWSYSYSYNPSWYAAGGGGYGTTPLSGLAAAYSVDGSFPAGNAFVSEGTDANTAIAAPGTFTGTFTIPVGQTGAWVVAQRMAGGSYSTVTTSLGVGVAGTYVPGATEKKSYRYNMTNGQGYNVRHVVEVDGVIVVNALIDAGGTSSGVIEIPTDAVVVERVFVPADYSDGGWVEAGLGPVGTGAGATAGTNDSITLPPGTATGTHAPGATPPATPINTNSVGPGTPGMPVAGAILPAGQTTWLPTTGTVDTERLDKKTYKEGVDKLLASDKKARDADKAKEDAQLAVSQAFLESLDEEVTAATTAALAQKNQAATDIGMSQTATMGSTAVTVPGASSSPLVITIPKLKNHLNFPDTLDLNPFTSARMPSWVLSVLALVKAFTGYGLVFWLWINTSKDIQKALMSLFMIHRDGESSVERAALNIPYIGGVVSLSLRYLYIVWLVAALYVAIPLLMALLENGIFSEYDVFASQVTSVLGSSGYAGQLIGIALNVVPLGTAFAVFAFRLMSTNAILLGIVPMAWMIRSFKV